MAAAAAECGGTGRLCWLVCVHRGTVSDERHRGSSGGFRAAADGMVTASKGCWGSYHQQLAVRSCGRCSQPPPSHPVKRQERKCHCLLSVND